MPVLERTERLPLTVDRSVLQKVVNADTPTAAAEIVLSYKTDDALSIIDNLDPLTAAFVIGEINRRLKWPGGSMKSKKKRWDAEDLLSKARVLQIRGMNGLCYARDQVFREMGYLAPG